MRALIPAGPPGELVMIGELAMPDPAPHQALIEVSDFSLNRADYLQLAVPGTIFRPGIDAAGVVEQAAADGSGPAEGSRVVMHIPGGGGIADDPLGHRRTGFHATATFSRPRSASPRPWAPCRPAARSSATRSN